VSTHADEEVYRKQGFGAPLGVSGRLALLLVDFVNGFAAPAVFGGGNIGSAVQETERLLARARTAHLPIAHSRIVYAADGSDSNLFGQKVPTLLQLTEDAPESQIVPSLTPLEGELVVRKTVPSAFFGTALAPWLTQRSVASLLVAGTTTSGCVRASVVDAMSFGFKPIVVRDCVGDRSLAAHESSLFDMHQKYCDILSLHEAMQAIEQTGKSRQQVRPADVLD
jgi:maleamate amidohydrolase